MYACFFADSGSEDEGRHPLKSRLLQFRNLDRDLSLSDSDSDEPRVAFHRTPSSRFAAYSSAAKRPLSRNISPIKASIVQFRPTVMQKPPSVTSKELQEFTDQVNRMTEADFLVVSDHLM